jgi:anti-sigma regulatory factor (Ser/Thr protein kinase)
MHVRDEPSSAGLVRNRVGADLARQGVDASCIDEVVLVVSELVGNAVRHAGSAKGELAICWDLDASGVRVEVTDASTKQLVRRTPSATDPSGRGLQIIDAMSDDWGVVPLRDGKRVWAHIPVRRAARRAGGSA